MADRRLLFLNEYKPYKKYPKIICKGKIKNLFLNHKISKNDSKLILKIKEPKKPLFWLDMSWTDLKNSILELCGWKKINDTYLTYSINKYNSLFTLFLNEGERKLIALIDNNYYKIKLRHYFKFYKRVNVFNTYLLKFLNIYWTDYTKIMMRKEAKFTEWYSLIYKDYDNSIIKKNFNYINFIENKEQLLTLLYNDEIEYPEYEKWVKLYHDSLLENKLKYKTTINIVDFMNITHNNLLDEKMVPLLMKVFEEAEWYDALRLRSEGYEKEEWNIISQYLTIFNYFVEQPTFDYLQMHADYSFNLHTKIDFLYKNSPSSKYVPITKRIIEELDDWAYNCSENYVKIGMEPWMERVLQICKKQRGRWLEAREIKKAIINVQLSTKKPFEMPKEFPKGSLEYNAIAFSRMHTLEQINNKLKYTLEHQDFFELFLDVEYHKFMKQVLIEEAVSLQLLISDRESILHMLALLEEDWENYNQEIIELVKFHLKPFEEVLVDQQMFEENFFKYEKLQQLKETKRQLIVEQSKNLAKKEYLQNYWQNNNWDDYNYHNYNKEFFSFGTLKKNWK